MRISSVVLKTKDDIEDLTFGLQERDASCRYTIRGMAGIDAEEVIPKFSGFGIWSSRRFYEYTMKAREIVMRVVLNPKYHVNETISDLRDRVYRIISANRYGGVTLEFMDGASAVCYIQGQITKLEVNHFSKTPELQVTLKCPDPILRSINQHDPFKADELSSTNPVKITDASSTAPHGFTFRVKFLATTASFAIWDDEFDPDAKFEVVPPTSFLINDTLEISSDYGRKRVYWDKAIGTNVHIVNYVTSDSVWPLLFPGLNTFWFQNFANYEFERFVYNTAYWGI